MANMDPMVVMGLSVSRLSEHQIRFLDETKKALEDKSLLTPAVKLSQMFFSHFGSVFENERVLRDIPAKELFAQTNAEDVIPYEDFSLEVVDWLAKALPVLQFQLQPRKDDDDEILWRRTTYPLVFERSLPYLEASKVIIQHSPFNDEEKEKLKKQVDHFRLELGYTFIECAMIESKNAEAPDAADQIATLQRIAELQRIAMGRS